MYQELIYLECKTNKYTLCRKKGVNGCGLCDQLYERITQSTNELKLGERSMNKDLPALGIDILASRLTS